MKKYIICAFLTFVFLFNIEQSFAQEGKEIQTLFENSSSISKEDLGFFLAPSFGITKMDGGNAALFNLRGGLSIKEKLGFGAYFNTSVNQIIPQSETNPNVYMDYWSVGAFGEYTWQPSKLVHLTFPLFVGYGEVQMDNEVGDAGLGEANFFQVEPSALIQLNLTRHLKLNFGLGYRMVSEMNYRNFNQSDISGLTGNIGFRINLF
ncbi:hypothetical protein MMU07_17470 [Aquiflexum sp. LQ15W]|uniref:hypothetical protein n=1 Tax=Cognataquiflexum nitidum TaxID=2922272 RepID=UPI001F136186|nr:hypothetical protein [Cognataquiflexum nitidum]MCH6201377.1 hypothetical protein [Cognataquiflexum nitidum]